MNLRRILLASLLACALTLPAHANDWPQQLVADDGSVVLIYQPQVEEFSGNSIEARAAVSVKRPSSGNTPVFGAIWLSARIDTDRDTRTAIIRDIDIRDVRFADAGEQEQQALATFIEEQVEGSSISGKTEWASSTTCCSNSRPTPA